MDRTVSRRSEPSSRAAFMGEQPNPWDVLPPQDATSRHRVPNLPVDMDSWGRSACYPRSTFYQISDAPSIRKRRITKPYFRTCSTLRSRSQAPLYLCALRAIANRTEGTFGLLRYLLGGYRPSKTAHLALFHDRITV